MQVPVNDAVTLEGNHIYIFLDINPLKRYRGTVTRVPYQSSVTEAGVLAYAGRNWRLTQIRHVSVYMLARVHGPRTTMFYFLFRRPITTMRQIIGV